MLFTFYFLLFTLGVSVGSFLNVIIDRLHTVEPIIAARSHCDHCGQTLRWHDLIPIFSFLWLRGRCRYCGKALSLQYPLVEIAAGLIFILGFSQIKDSQFFIFHFSFFIFIASAMIVIFVYDLKHKIIPDQIVLPAIAITFLFRLFCKDQPCGPQGWSLFTIPFAGALLNPLLSASIAGLFFLCLILATKGRGMGFGDVKLVFLMGLILGWPQILIALYLSFIVGSLVGLFLIAVGKKHFGQEIPFGPFLSASTIATLLYGESLLHLFRTFIPII